MTEDELVQLIAREVVARVRAAASILRATSCLSAPARSRAKDMFLRTVMCG